MSCDNWIRTNDLSIGIRSNPLVATRNYHIGRKQRGSFEFAILAHIEVTLLSLPNIFKEQHKDTYYILNKQ